MLLLILPWVVKSPPHRTSKGNARLSDDSDDLSSITDDDDEEDEDDEEEEEDDDEVDEICSF